MFKGDPFKETISRGVGAKAVEPRYILMSLFTLLSFLFSLRFD